MKRRLFEPVDINGDHVALVLRMQKTKTFEAESHSGLLAALADGRLAKGASIITKELPTKTIYSGFSYLKKR